MKLINSRVDIAGIGSKMMTRIRGSKETTAIVFLEPGDMVSGCIFEDTVITCNPGTSALFEQCMILDSSIEKKRKGTPDNSSIIIENTIFRRCRLPLAWYGECILDGKVMGD